MATKKKTAPKKTPHKTIVNPSPKAKTTALAKYLKPAAAVVKPKKGGAAKLQLPEPVLSPVASALLTQANSIHAQVKLLEVTAATLPRAQEMLVQLAKGLKSLEADRQFLTKPLKDHAKRIESVYRPATERFEAADELLRNKVLDFQREAAKAVAEAQAQLTEQAEAAAEEGDSDTALELATQATTMEAATVVGRLASGGGTGLSMVSDFEVVDFALVPDEYFTLDHKKIRAAVKAGLTEIPGIRIFKTERLSVFSGESAEKANSDAPENISYPEEVERISSEA